jgi:DNA-binding LytR/AlgR family response regulator
MKVAAEEEYSEPYVLTVPAVRKTRIVVRKGKSFVPLLVNEIAMCYTSDKITFIQLFNGNKYFADYNLSDLMQVFDPLLFFRVNRRTIINIDAIKEYRCISFSKIVVDLIPLNRSSQQLIVSQVTAPLFKKWIHNQ